MEQLAAACGVSVDTVRYYQSLGLLQPPDREGRVAMYGPDHAERIRVIRSLQRSGLTLAAIGRVVRGELGKADADLALAVAAARGDGEEELLSLEEFSRRSGVPASLIQAVEREGVPFGHEMGEEIRYTAGDIAIVRVALRLLEFGLPLAELLALAREANESLRRLAERSVDLFDEHVRKPIRHSVSSDEVAAGQMVEAFAELLPAVTQLVTHHFRRVLLEAAEEKLEGARG